MPRPTKMTKATLGKLREAFMMGYSDREACAYADIHPDTLYAYQTLHSEFSDQKALWKLFPILKAKKTILDALNKGDLKTSQWYLERKARDEFGPQPKEADDEQPQSIAALFGRIDDRRKQPKHHYFSR